MSSVDESRLSNASVMTGEINAVFSPGRSLPEYIGISDSSMTSGDGTVIFGAAMPSLCMD
ncbi:MAG: hypothetical protein IJU23_06060 [Proteobacteria bacterium]|nr:hypothetical protein [Pseudomonadota bacterium]